MAKDDRWIYEADQFGVGWVVVDNGGRVMGKYRYKREAAAALRDAGWRATGAYFNQDHYTREAA